MGTLAANRKGYITGASSSTYEEALGATTGIASDSQTGNVNTAIQYFFSTGRGGGVHRFIRTFIHFNTSGISGGSSFQLVVTSTAGSSSDSHSVVAVNHSAGTSNGGELANDDFNNIIRGTAWSSATAWASSGQISINLNAAAANQIINNNDFNVALILQHDFNQEEESPLEESGDISDGIAFGSAINLTYTDPASGYTHKINGLASASIGKVNTVATGSIGKINTVD
tara:strand:+ start:42 stop:725 length:684 start_codon:yes stop_codon:yes gene_type:complete